MKKQILKSNLVTLLFLFGLSNIVNAQTIDWVKQIGGTGTDVSKSIIRDASGNIYTTGVYQGTVDFDPGPGTFNLTSTAAGFILKLDAGGSFVWVKELSGPGNSITLDAFGNIYVAGSSIYSSLGGFISKLDATGNAVWTKQFSGFYPISPYSISLDASGDIFTTGTFQQTIDFDLGAGTFELTSVGDQDAFILKLDAAGNFLWVKQIGGPDTDIGTSIVLDAFGNSYTVGGFIGTAYLEPVPGSGLFGFSTPGRGSFILKLDAAGNFVWAKQISGTISVEYCFPTSIILDAYGNSYTTGAFQGAADFDPGEGVLNLTSGGSGKFAAFILKLDAAGNFVWAKHMGGANSHGFGSSSVLDASGNIYTAGTLAGTVDFDPGSGTFNLTSAGVYNNFISKLDAAGNFVWAKQTGGLYYAPYFSGHTIVLDASGNIYTTGSFEGGSNFEPGGPGSYNLVTAGLRDIFILKVSTVNSSVTDVLKDSDLLIYPNPTMDVLNFSSQVNVHLSNLLGQIVAKKNNVNTLDLSEQPKGVYFITLLDNNGQVIQKNKIIKE